MLVAVVMPDTVTGVEELVVELFPSWPEKFRPQHLTVESLKRAQEWSLPVATLVAVAMPETVTKLVELIVVPFPSWPERFRPTHLTLPSLQVTQAWFPPWATPVTWLMVL